MPLAFFHREKRRVHTYRLQYVSAEGLVIWDGGLREGPIRAVAKSTFRPLPFILGDQGCRMVSTLRNGTGD